MLVQVWLCVRGVGACRELVAGCFGERVERVLSLREMWGAEERGAAIYPSWRASDRELARSFERLLNASPPTPRPKTS